MVKTGAQFIRFYVVHTSCHDKNVEMKIMHVSVLGPQFFSLLFFHCLVVQMPGQWQVQLLRPYSPSIFWAIHAAAHGHGGW